MNIKNTSIGRPINSQSRLIDTVSETSMRLDRKRCYIDPNYARFSIKSGTYNTVVSFYYNIYGDTPVPEVRHG